MSSGQMSFWTNVLLGKRPSGQMSSGQMSLWANVFLGKRLLGERLMGKCPSGQMSFWANVFWADVFWANVVLGKCLWANVVWANVGSPLMAALCTVGSILFYRAGRFLLASCSVFIVWQPGKYTHSIQLLPFSAFLIVYTFFRRRQPFFSSSSLSFSALRSLLFFRSRVQCSVNRFRILFGRNLMVLAQYSVKGRV
jgi:hypothetical protein